MTECCGQARDSRFCPECGAQLISDPLIDLLKYCRSMEAGCRKRGERGRHKLGDDQDQWSMRLVEGQARAVAKWQLWGAALAARMEPAPASQEGEDAGR